MTYTKKAQNFNDLKSIIKDVFEDSASYQRIEMEAFTYAQVSEKCRKDNAISIFTPINIYCINCKGDSVFNVERALSFHIVGNSLIHVDKSMYEIFNNVMMIVFYGCSICNIQRQFFMIEMKADHKDKFFITKVAAWPRQKFQESKDIKAELNRYDIYDYYSKGRIVEAHGYGLAAAAYYRRAVEQTINKIIEEMKGTLSKEALKLWIDTHGERPTTATKIDEALKYLNSSSEEIPLHTVYTHLSDGIHNLTDEECLQDAGSLRELLILAIEEAAQQRKRKEAVKRFKDQLNAQRGQRGQANKGDA